MKALLSTLIVIIFHINLHAQEIDSTLIAVKGKVVDSASGEPVEEAKIRYESLPYGSKIGILSGDSFSFNMEDSKNYHLLVRAEGYESFDVEISADSASNGVLKKLIKLRSNSINELIRLEKLIFALGKADITPESHAELDELAAKLEANKDMTIQLEGHTDFRGDPKQNMKLSERRVEAVKKYLVDKGIHKNRIQTKAFGGAQPLSRGNDAESRRNNRRVEVRILSN